MDIYQIPFFKGIDLNVVKAVNSVCSTTNFDSGHKIFTKGDSADFLYILETGSVELLLKEEDQTRFLLTEPGEVFGWSSIVEKGVYTSTATCKSATCVLKISKQDIEEIFNQYPKAAIKFYQRLGSIFSKRISKAIE